jgi:putative membrane protein insertion efficiency factor
MRLFPRRAAAPILLLVVVAAFAFDASRPPTAQVTTRLALAGIHVYQRTASPYLPAVGVRCRFTPTCSRYAEAVLRRYGILRGTMLSVVRVARCGPWTPAGTEDPPP